ncbi:hypothetical protein HN51_028274 [Arachis hypogaea]
MNAAAVVSTQGGIARPCRFCRRQREKEVRAPVRNARKESSPKPEQIHRENKVAPQSYLPFPFLPST